jgi:RimJ/RimL family protein N-acetyltransferase
MSIQIETARLILRLFTESDAAAASYNSKQPTVAHFMSDMVLDTEEAALGWICWLNKDKFDAGIPCIVLAVEMKASKKCIGLIGVAPKRELDNEIEILFSIADEYQKQGYITEAGKGLIDWTFENTITNYLVAIIKLDNPASVRVIKKLGFAYNGERRIDYDGEMTDFHYYRLEKSNYPRIIAIREHPSYLNRAVDYFSSKWSINRKIYEDSISNGITTENPLPRWYLMFKGDDIIGSYGLIENDFMVRKDLMPWLCALYVEESERNRALGSRLLEHGRQEAVKLGFSKVYLCTDHVGYYEKYDWKFFEMQASEWGTDTRVFYFVIQ